MQNSLSLKILSLKKSLVFQSPKGNSIKSLQTLNTISKGKQGSTLSSEKIPTKKKLNAFGKYRIQSSNSLLSNINLT
jgi:hypothetical protein